MEITNLYTAKEAREEYDVKIKSVNEFVDYSKLISITKGIKKKINAIEISPTYSFTTAAFYEYAGTLSIKEQEILKSLGYILQDGLPENSNSYWKIIW